MEFLDPTVDIGKSREGMKIDYITLLFQIEKPVYKEHAKNTKIPSLAFQKSLLDAIDNFVLKIAP
jgi:hypothetical protein